MQISQLFRNDLSHFVLALSIGLIASWITLLVANDSIDGSLRKGVKAHKYFEAALYGCEPRASGDVCHAANGIDDIRTGRLPWIPAGEAVVTRKEIVDALNAKAVAPDTETVSRLTEASQKPVCLLGTVSCIGVRRYINGFIQFLTIAAGFTGLALILSVQFPIAIRERRAVLVRPGRKSENELLEPWPESPAERRAISDETVLTYFDQVRAARLSDEKAGKGRMVVACLDSVCSAVRSTYCVIDGFDALTSQLDHMRLELDSRRHLVRWLAWLVPSIGFIGTVLGIGGALEQAYKVVEYPIPAMQVEAVEQITSILGTAFDTTLIALIVSIPLMFLLAAVNRYEDRTIALFEAAVSSNVLHRLCDAAKGDPDTSRLHSQVDELVVGIAERIARHFARLEASRLRTQAEAIDESP